MYRRSIRRQSCACGQVDARQDFTDSSRREDALWRPAQPFRGDPVSFVVGGTRLDAGVPQRLRLDRGRRGDGRQAQELVRGRRPVPSRIDLDSERKTTAAQLSRSGRARMSELRQSLARLIAGQSLSEEQSGAAVEEIFTGDAPPPALVA